MKWGAAQGSAGAPAGAASRFAMSIDVEDYYQVWAFADVVDRRRWDSYAPRVDYSTRLALDLIDAHGAKATFFTLGWVAERHPRLVREIVARGHEIGSHGCDHAKIFDQTADEFRADAARSKRVLEDIAGVEVAGYRAPGFSIGAACPWAHEILASVGYRYSSSAHPIRHDHYGDPAGPRAPYGPIAGSAFIEAPVATAELYGRRFSCAGGGWFRATPYAIFKALLVRAAATTQGPVIFYFHPWELDRAQPRIPGASLKSRARHYLNLDLMRPKLERLLSDYSWGRIDEALGLRAARAAA